MKIKKRLIKSRFKSFRPAIRGLKALEIFKPRLNQSVLKYISLILMSSYFLCHAVLGSADALKESGDLTFQSCDSSLFDSNITQNKIQCGFLNRITKNIEFHIPFVILKASSQKKSEDLLVIIPGGPGVGGQTESKNINYWLDFFVGQNRFFDIFLFSPRGTPGSKPGLNCENFPDNELVGFSKNLSASQQYQAQYQNIEFCLDALKNKNLVGSISGFEQVKDLQALVELVDYKKVHLFAESWGTRVALQARSEKIKTRILDSSYPPGKGGFLDWIPLLDFRFDIYRKNVKDFDALLAKAKAKLDQKPLVRTYEINLPPPYDQIDFVLNSQRLTTISFFALYRENLRKPFVEMLEYIASGKEGKDSLVLIMQRFLQSYFDPTFSSLAWFATECAENPRLSRDEFDALAAQAPSFAYFIDGIYEFDPCHLPNFAEHKPLNNDLSPEIPTLLLSGEFDPVTPNTWSQELQKQLGKQSILYSALGAGHGIFAGAYCEPLLIIDFIKHPKLNPQAYCESN